MPVVGMCSADSVPTAPSSAHPARHPPEDTVGVVVDPGHGWCTARLGIEPLTRSHAEELFAVLNDPHLHEFTGGSPLPLAALADRYTRLESRRSPDGTEVWCNWVLRERNTGVAVGTVQATLPADGPVSGHAEVAWVVARRVQGRGYASEAAISLVDHLRSAGWAVVAHVHPEHLASQRVACKAGLRPTEHVVAGEVRWE
jgi:RimJ/RimL family protein N-acetyltransferase